MEHLLLSPTRLEGMESSSLQRLCRRFYLVSDPP